MKQSIVLARALRKAREGRGWSIGYAASRTLTVGRQTLTNLELGVSDPAKCQVRTVVELLNLYYHEPSVLLSDFLDAETVGELSVSKHVSRAVDTEGSNHHARDSLTN